MASCDAPWWKRTTVYQIYPRSFSDANGDGIGDLQGILGRLDYLHALGVETLWISPFFQSPQADFGYDVSDHLGVAPEYGSLDDVRRLVDETHARGMKIVFDMVLNHTSEHHPWFLDSRRSRESDKRSWYIWREGRKPGGAAPPNNWKSMLGGSGWRYDEASGEWYWASFLPFQPDLNYRNPEVKRAMLGVVRHWLEQGVDGLRLDIFNAIYKDASFDDNPFSFRPVPSEHNPHGFFQRYHHTLDHPDTFVFSRELRALSDEFSDPPRFLVGEVFGDAGMLRRYCGEEADGLHMVFLFKAMRTRFAGRAVRALIEEFERAFPDPFMPTYVFGNHDRPRFIHRLGEDVDKAKLFAMMQLTVRGVPFIYYGEEIGMLHHEIPLLEGLDPIASRFRLMPQWMARGLQRFGILLNRDECRLPMQWSHGPNAGFSAGHAEPWLPMHPDAGENNVAAQERDPASLLNCYRNLLALRRKSRALAGGSLEMHDVASLPRAVVAYRRAHGEGADQEAVDVYLNFGRSPVKLDLRGQAGRTLVSNRRGEARAPNADEVLGPYEGVMVMDP